jgi:preprotein translocase subunit YajC
MDTALITQFMPLIMIFGIFYFMLIRPQQKKMKAHQEMLAALKKGDQVVAGGGMVGIIQKIISNEHIALQINENVDIVVLRSSVTDVLAGDRKLAKIPGESHVTPLKKTKK